MLKCHIYSLGSKNPRRLSCWINLSLPPPTPTPNQVSHSRECNLLCCDIVVNLQSGPHSRGAPVCRRRQWRPTAVLLPGKSHGRRSLVGCNPWGCEGDWAPSLSLFTFRHWRRQWQPTPVFLPGESQGWGSLVGCHLWGRTESDTTKTT